jgi:serine/threonine-protein phosphatase 2A regulatory subunit B'
MPQDPLLHPSAYNHHAHPSRANASTDPSSSPPTPLVPSATNSTIASSSPMHGLTGNPSTPPKNSVHHYLGSPNSPGTPRAVRAIPGSAGSGSGVTSLGITGSGTMKDVIPISKTPRKQRSSRFVVDEHVELERLPGLAGASMAFPYLCYRYDDLLR